MKPEYQNIIMLVVAALVVVGVFLFIKSKKDKKGEGHSDPSPPPWKPIPTAGQPITPVVASPPTIPRRNVFFEFKAKNFNMMEILSNPGLIELRRQAGGPTHGDLDVLEVIFAREAGYVVDPPPPPPAWVDPNPTDLSDWGGKHDNALAVGGKLVLTFTLAEPQTVEVASCALAGPGFHNVTSSVSGPVGIDFGSRGVSYNSVRDKIQSAPAGTYTYTLSGDNVGVATVRSQIVKAS